MGNHTVIGKCLEYSSDGQGIVRVDNKKIFVPSLLKDEEAEIEIIYSKKDYDVGKIKRLIKLSKDRINPLCPCSTSCGGCSFQNLNYQKELGFKYEFAKKTLVKALGNNIKIESILGMDNPYYYRNKIQIPLGYDKQNRLVYGFYKAKSHDIIPIKECVIENKIHVEILENIKELMLKLKIPAYNEDKQTGIIRHILIRYGEVSKETMLVIVVNSFIFKNSKVFIDELVKKNPEITTIVFNLNSRHTNVILGEKEKVVYGKGYIYDYLCNIKFKISSKSFYQINHEMCEKLYDLAIKKANLNKNNTILDAYCGIGTIGLIASKYVKEVNGVEIVSDAIKDAINNAKINNITNVNYVCGDANDFIFNKKFDCVFVDPPRKGLDPNFINSLLKSLPKKIVYVSCNVESLADNLKLLKEKYDIKSINLVDMFPRTIHVETIVGLVRKDNKID